MQNEKHNFLLVLGLLVLAQSVDFLYTIPASPFWQLYLHGGFIDGIVAYILIAIAFNAKSELALTLLALQSIYVLVHLMGFTSEFLYNSTSYSIFAQLCNLYTPVLIVILVFKTVVLGKGGYGIYRRHNTSTNSRVYPVAVIISPDHHRNDSEKMAKASKGR